MNVQARRVELKIRRAFRHRQRLDNVNDLALQFLILFNGEQHMRRLAPVGDEYRAFERRLFGAA